MKRGIFHRLKLIKSFFGKVTVRQLWLLRLFFFWIFVALLADIIATDKPLMIRVGDQTWFPAFSSLFDEHRTEILPSSEPGISPIEIDFEQTNWKQIPNQFVVWAPIPWSHEHPDKYNRDYVGPFDVQKYKNPQGELVSSGFFFRHHFGTDHLGNDVLAMLIHASRISLKIGLLSTLLAALIGILLGSLAGYYGDYGIRVSRGRKFMGFIGFFSGVFWAFISRNAILSDAFAEGFFYAFLEIILSLIIIILSTLGGNQLGRILELIPSFKRPTTFAIDSAIQRFTEIFSTIPKLLILLTLAAIFRDKSIGMVILIIGLSAWTSVSRFTRAEFLRIRSLTYIEAARASGLREVNILFKQALPNALGPIIIDLTFLISGSILAESSLSFLGIGVPADIKTWGSILSEGRQEFDAWWMIIFPGLAIFFTVLLFNGLGERFRRPEHTEN